MCTFAVVIVEDAESNVSSAPGHIQNSDCWGGAVVGVEVVGGEISKFIDEVVLPVAVNPHRHSVVHDIVLVGDRVEDFVNERLFFCGGDIAEAEVVVEFIIFLSGGKEPEKCSAVGSVHY